MASNTYKITAGPSKFDLMVSLFAGNRDHRNLVSFNVKGPQTTRRFDVFIESVEREDGSGESYNLVVGWSGKKLSMYYSTRTRSGVVTIVD